MGGFKYKQEGDKIHYNDQIILFHLKTKLYLHVTERLLKIEEPRIFQDQGILTNHQTSNRDNNPQDKFMEGIARGIQEITPKKIDRRFPPNSYAPHFEVNISNVKTKFQIQVFSYYNEDNENQFIKGGMICRLLHSEKGGYMHSDDKDFSNDGAAEVYLWNFKGKVTSLEAMSSSSLFEIEVANPLKLKSCKSKAKAQELEIKRQDENRRFGKVCHYSKEEPPDQSFKKDIFYQEDQVHFRFRHLNTGRLVIDQEIEYHGNKIKTLGLGPHINIRNHTYWSERQLDDKDIELLGQIDKSSKNFELEIIEDSSFMPETFEQLDQRSRFRIISTSPSLDTRIKHNSCV